MNLNAFDVTSVSLTLAHCSIVVARAEAGAWSQAGAGRLGGGSAKQIGRGEEPRSCCVNRACMGGYETRERSGTNFWHRGDKFPFKEKVLWLLDCATEWLTSCLASRRFKQRHVCAARLVVLLKTRLNGLELVTWTHSCISCHGCEHSPLRAGRLSAHGTASCNHRTHWNNRGPC